ncbi:MAG: S8 family serine peptidase [Candidatus Bipolaricaulia bacterium]
MMLRKIGPSLFLLLLFSLVALGSGRTAPLLPELAQSLPQIGVDEVHRLGITGRGVGVLVIDSFTPPPSDPFPHGEWVAGIAGAVAPGATIWRSNLEGFATVEGGWSFYDSELRDALATALAEHRERGIRVINMSLGGGTSAAAPHVAGVAALLLEADPDLTGPELVDLLRETGVPVTTSGSEISFGLTFPRVDALAAVQRLIEQSKKAEIVLQGAWLTPQAVAPGEAVTVTVALENRGDAPGTVPIVIRADGAVMVDTEAAVEAKATTTLSYQVSFPQPGSYEITLDTADGEEQIGTVEVRGGEPGPVCAIAGADGVVDGADLIGAIQRYARGEFSGSDLIRVIQYYATGTECDQGLSALNIGLIAPQGVVEVELTADLSEVQPGGELELTARLKANQKITGLLLHIDLPSGWELFPIDNGDATTFKQRSREWLWIDVGAGGEKQVRFRVRAAADAPPGDYEIGGRVMTAVPELDFALTPLTVRVGGEPVEFKVEDVTVTPSPVTSSGAEFRAEGTGILKVEAWVYSLEGRLLFNESADGSSLEFPAVDTAGRPLANGVYLYQVTVHGVNDGLWQSEVRKLIILR